MRIIDRRYILVLGDFPLDRTHFEQRNLKFKPITINQLDDKDLTYNARGVLVAVFPGKFNLIGSYFDERFYQASELGLMTAVLLTQKKPVQINAIRNAALGRFRVFDDITDPKEREHCFESSPWVYLGEKECEIAQKFVEYIPGPPLGNPIIKKIDQVSIDKEIEVILKRAFHDCDYITVKNLEGGKTAEATFQVNATFSGSEFGPQPMPFFVKFGSFTTTDEEKRAYREQAEPFIPFYLRPALIEERCVTTPYAAALVCNFVESAVSLRGALRAGQGHGVIFSLFEVTLRGLRSHTLNGPKSAGVIERFFDPDPKIGRVRAHEIKKQHPERIKQLIEFGITREPEEVENILRQCSARIATHQGPYHGDPHVGNIMVRNRDAIVIDFASMARYGPLSADPAILEVSLLFGTDKGDDPESFDSWRDFIDYVFKNPLSPPLPIGDHPQFEWLHKAVRELRHVVVCCGVENLEALIILAGCLLRFGRHSILNLDDDKLNMLAEKRRVYALVVADRICNTVVEMHKKIKECNVAG